MDGIGNPRALYIARCLRTIRRLAFARQGVTVYELAQSEGVSVRTIYPYINAIEMAGIPLVSVEGADGRARWKLFRRDFLDELGVRFSPQAGR